MLSDNKLYTLGIDDYDAIMHLVRELDDDLSVPGFERRFTMEIEQATEQGLGDFGRMNDADIETASDKNIPAGSTEPDTGRHPVSKEVICPSCGHIFEP